MANATSPESQGVSATSFVVCLLGIYVALTFYLTLTPFEFVLDADRFDRWLAQGKPIQLFPLWWSDFVGNVLLFVPIGLLGVLSRRQSHPATNLALLTFAGAILSLAIESLQVFTTTRQPGLPDVLANTCGALLGACTGVLANRTTVADYLTAGAKRLGNHPLAFACIGTLLLAVSRGLTPFDVSLHANALRRSLRTVQLDPFADPGIWLGEPFQVLSLAILGGLMFRWASGYMQRWKAVILALGIAVALATAIELLQIALKSRTTATRDVLSCLVGVGAGILISGAVRWPAERVVYRAALIVYSLFAGLLIANPLGLHPSTDMIKVRLLELIPMYWVHFQSNLTASTESLSTTVLFVPIGYLAVKGAMKTPSLLGLATVPLVCASTAYALYSVHSAVAGHTHPTAGVLEGFFGALIGTAASLVQSRLFYRPASTPNGGLHREAEGMPLAIPR